MTRKSVVREATNGDQVNAVTLIDAAGNAVTSLGGSSSVSSGTPVSLASGTSSATVVASNSSRVGLILTNTDANICYLKFGSSASSSSFTYLLNPSDVFEMGTPVYTGIVTAIWAADGSGSLIGTEL